MTNDPSPNPPLRTEHVADESNDAIVNPKPKRLTPTDLRRLRPTFIDVTVPNLGDIRLHRLPYSEALEMLTTVQNMRTRGPDEPDDATVEVDEIKAVLCGSLCASLGGEWDSESGLEALQGLHPDEVFTLSRIMNAISGVGVAIPVGADPWEWAVQYGRSMIAGGQSPENEAIETAKNE